MEDTKQQTVVGADSADVDLTLKELGETALLTEPLSAEDDQRILRKIDMWYIIKSCSINYNSLTFGQPAPSHGSLISLPIPRQVCNGVHLNSWASN